jgi:hypothetical protein
MIGLLDKIIAAGGDVWVVGGDLRLRIPTGLLTQAERSILANNKAEIVKLLAHGPGPAAETPVVGTTAEPDLDREIVVPPPPCQQCGGFMFWWDIAGGVHCMACEPAVRSVRTREAAERIRRRTA